MLHLLNKNADNTLLFIPIEYGDTEPCCTFNQLAANKSHDATHPWKIIIPCYFITLPLFTRLKWCHQNGWNNDKIQHVNFHLLFAKQISFYRRGCSPPSTSRIHTEIICAFSLVLLVIVLRRGLLYCVISGLPIDTISC